MIKTESMPHPGETPEVTSPRLTKRRAQTRLRMLEAASEVFGSKGFGRTTVEDVCDQAGFTRGAFYSNFDSLDELFLSLQQQRSEMLIRAVSAAVESTIAEFTGATPSVADLMKRVVADLPVDRQTQLLNLEFTAHAMRHPDVAHALAGYRAALRQAIVPILQLGIAATTGSSPSTTNLDSLARVILAIHEGMSTQQLLEPDETFLAELRQEALTSIVSAAL